MTPETQRIVYGFLSANRHALEAYIIARKIMESGAEGADEAIEQVDEILNEVEDGRDAGGAV